MTTPDALTREQVETIELHAKLEYRISHPGSCAAQRIAACRDVLVLVAHDTALRQALAQSEQAAYDVAGTIDQLKERIAQQAQTIERVHALELQIREVCDMELNALSNMGIGFIEKAVRWYQQCVTQQAQEVGRLEGLLNGSIDANAVLIAKLTAMTTARGEQGRYACEMLTECKRAQMAEQEALKQLATAQARCQVLEKGYADQTAVRERHEAGFRETIGQLQATLAAREAELHEVKMQCGKNAMSHMAEYHRADAAVQEAGRLRDILQAIVSANERGQGLPFQAAMREALLALHVRYNAQRATGSSGGAVCHAKP